MISNSTPLSLDQSVVIPVSRRRRRVCELLGGKPFDQDDLIFLMHTTTEEVKDWLREEDFRFDMELNRRRADHILRFFNFHSQETGVHITMPTPIAEEDLPISLETRIRAASYGYDFIQHTLSFAVALGVKTASRLTGVPQTLVKDWLYSKEAKVSKFRDELLDIFTTKTADVVNSITNELADAKRIKESSTKELAYTLGILYDKGKDAAIKRNIDTSVDASRPDMTNIVNILVSDPEKKTQVIDAIITKMTGQNRLTGPQRHNNEVDCENIY